MANLWKESSSRTKVIIGLSLAGAAGVTMYLSYKKIHASVGSGGKHSQAMNSAPKMHVKCMMGKYPRGDVMRGDVPKDRVPWDTAFPEYKPVCFTSDSVAKKPVWADVDYMTEKNATPEPQWNSLDGKVDRRSHNGKYQIVDNLPRNPVGRTGICARGTLGRWGPNHAADPIVTRWKRDDEGNIVKNSASGKPVLQFVAVLRSDSGIWAIPGGMVDPGEKVSVTLKREFGEEALNTLEMSEKDKQELEDKITDLFQHGTEVYRGYVDDPRNTDNSWMETIAVNFHDGSGTTIGRVDLNAGDDAVGVQWADINSSLNLFASHLDFIKQVAQLHDAHW